MIQRGREAAGRESAGAETKLKVSFEPEARAYVRERGGHVTVRASRRLGCCGGTAFLPMAEAKKPGADGDDFLRWEEGDVTVWLSRRFVQPPGGGGVRPGAPPDPDPSDPTPLPLRIGLNRVLGFRRLQVEGLGITT
ncbi:MAG: hypothetical protein EA422_15325 [Gemmatimonadales bacterium]|nr:MAG: hypothetical protein EA422_15325 [Gemmatimonadales bacterium]